MLWTANSSSTGPKRPRPLRRSLAAGGAHPHDGVVWWKRPEQVLDAETLNDLIRILMRIEAKLEDVLELSREDDDEEEEADE